jgi:YgiT-type zinc finger domain-containing protein
MTFEERLNKYTNRAICYWCRAEDHRVFTEEKTLVIDGYHRLVCPDCYEAYMKEKEGKDDEECF